ncbi:MAG: Bax inhibitor-1/YccA family protein [Porphyromonadaceae bacterium]|nr:Bax inhibitor-1/YccA family protein [Porphyromonadaceae bacterium]
MENNYFYNNYRQEEVSTTQITLMKSLYLWMCIALAITGITAMAVEASYSLQQLLFSGRYTFLILVIAEVGLVIYLSARLFQMSFSSAMVSFLVYSFLNGLTLSVIFMAYTKESIASTFFVTAGTFAVMCLYGYFTKRDLSSWGNLLLMALVGLIIASVVNFFWANSTLYWAITYIGVLIFVGLTAFDTQRFKRILANQEINETTQKVALVGALSLYLDFVNMFLYLLRIFGNRR